MKIETSKEKLFFYGLLLLIGYGVYLLVKPYISVTILAYITAVLFDPVYEWFNRVFKKRSGWAAGLTVVVVLITVLLPVILMIQVTISQIISFNKDLNEVITNNKVDLSGLIASVNDSLDQIPGIDYRLSQDRVYESAAEGSKSIANFLLGKAINIGSSSVDWFGKSILFIILLFAFLPTQKDVVTYLKRLSPLKDSLDNLYAVRIQAMAKSMIFGSLVIAVVQGVLAGIFLAIAGVKYIWFLTLLMIFFGIIPLGATTISIPIGIALLVFGQIWQGLLVILGSILIVGNIDNVIRPMLVSKDAEVHPALLILAVFGGLRFFGLWGVIYGPVLVILLTTTLEIYLEYSNNKNKNLGR